MERYEGQVGGKPIVYTPDGIQFGNVPVPFDQMTGIKIIEGATPSWQFTFNGRHMQVPYTEEERACVEPFINEAIVSEALKGIDPMEMELPGAAAPGQSFGQSEQPQAPGTDGFASPGQPQTAQPNPADPVSPMAPTMEMPAPGDPVSPMAPTMEMPAPGAAYGQAPGPDSFASPGQPEAAQVNPAFGQPQTAQPNPADPVSPMAPTMEMPAQNVQDPMGQTPVSGALQTVPDPQDQFNGYGAPGGSGAQSVYPDQDAARMNQAGAAAAGMPGQGMQDPTVVNNVQIAMSQQNQGTQLQAFERRINKHIFVWICTFLVGGFGVDRFMRGQIGLGILKIITCSGVGVWATVDWIIGMVKAYGAAFGQEEEVVFLNGKYAR